MINIIKFLVNIIFCKILYRVKYINKENEQTLDKCLICPNHSIWADPTFIYPKTNNIIVMAKAELFKNKIIGAIFTYAGIFSIKRGQKDGSSVLHAINYMKKSKKAKLLVFPEGTRVKQGIHVDAKVGPAFIAIKSGVSIVPVYISQYPKLFSKVYVKYGKPIYLDVQKHNDKKYLKEKSDEILNEIYSMK